MTKEELYTRVDAELLTGVSAKDVANKYGMPYITVIGRKNNLTKIEVPVELIDTPVTRAALEIIRDKIAIEAPKAAKTADMIIDGIEGLKVLNTDIQDALAKVVKKVNYMLDNEELDEDGNVVPMSKRDLQILSNILTSVYSAINAKGTTVNVATAVTTGEQNMSFFKANVRSV
jgi:hypothetical protein